MTLTDQHTNPARSQMFSVLFDDTALSEDTAPIVDTEPESFHDLGLAPVVADIISGAQEHALEQYFYTTVGESTVRLRHAVFRDVDTNTAVRSAVADFQTGMDTVRRIANQSTDANNRYEQMCRHLQAVRSYLDAVASFGYALSASSPRSPALRQVADHLNTMATRTPFTAMREEVSALGQEFDEVSYCVLIKDDSVNVRAFEDEPDYSGETREILAPLTSGRYPTPDLARRDPHPRLNSVESRILDRVALLFPDVFTHLDRFRQRTGRFVDDQVAVIDRELRFYTQYLAFARSLSARGVSFCYPRLVTDAETTTWCTEAFDVGLALSRRSTTQPQPMVCNSFRLDPPELAIVVSGPNQGGKTTFARMTGQVYHLAALGVPVPGRDAQILLPDHVYTHFEREENAESERGKLADELTRIHDVLDHATAQSVVIMNESFTSTSLHDSRLLGRAILEQMLARGIRCVYVTFLEELSRLSPATVSMVSTVDPDQPQRRTFRIERRVADGRAYAEAIAQKYSLTYSAITDRLS